MKRLSPQETQTFLTSSNAIQLLDVREKWEYDICHLTDSLNIPMAEIPARLTELAGNMITIVICHHGARSLQVAGFLENEGFTNIINLEGGVDAWAEDIDTTMPRY